MLLGRQVDASDTRHEAISDNERHRILQSGAVNMKL